MASISEITRQIKSDSFQMSLLSGEIRNQALDAISRALVEKKDLILEANKSDLEKAALAKLGSPIIKRLKFDEQKLSDVISGIQSLISLKDPLWNVSLTPISLYIELLAQSALSVLSLNPGRMPWSRLRPFA